MRVKSTLRALSQFSSRSITITYFLQKFLSCNTLCAIIVADTTNSVFSRSYLDFRAGCDMLFMETYTVCFRDTNLSDAIGLTSVDKTAPP